MSWPFNPNDMKLRYPISESDEWSGLVVRNMMDGLHTYIAVLIVILVRERDNTEMGLL